jgi:hypothetical protein
MNSPALVLPQKSFGINLTVGLAMGLWEFVVKIAGQVYYAVLKYRRRCRWGRGMGFQQN